MAGNIEPVARIHALPVGVAAWRAGAGRARKEDPVSPGAGVTLHVSEGQRVTRGQRVATLHADNETLLQAGLAAFTGAVDVGTGPASSAPRVIARVTS